MVRWGIETFQLRKATASSFSKYAPTAPKSRSPLPRRLWSANRYKPDFDLYTYTGGRWLDLDHERRDARRLSFNFDALLDKAIKCSPGAQRVIDCEKKEGGFNRVFVIKLDNGKTVVARIPTRIAGPPKLTVSSEVATIRYVSERTGVPVPEVLGWSSDVNNAVGAEYILMNTVPGVPLKDVWNKMPASQHIECIESLGEYCRDLCELEFPGYGSLYLNDYAPANAEQLDNEYSLGPLCGHQHWGCGVSKEPMAKKGAADRGPWFSLEAYLAGLVSLAKPSTSIEVARLSQTRATDAKEHPELLATAHETLKLLTRAEAVKESGRPILSHPDFNTRNIFVDADESTKITGIIDWQSAAVEPAFVFEASTPDFAEELLHDDQLDKKQDGEPDASTPQGKLQIDVDFCMKTWAVMLSLSPGLCEAASLELPALHFLAAGSIGWLDDPVATRSLMTDLSERWEDFELPGTCPYQSSEEDKKAFDVRRDEIQATQRLRIFLSRVLQSDPDGWVHRDRWEEVLPLYRRQYDNFVQSCIDSREEKGQTEGEAITKANKLWPYDQR